MKILDFEQGFPNFSNSKEDNYGRNGQIMLKGPYHLDSNTCRASRSICDYEKETPRSA
ncbi:hypothetical protein DPMN_170409 [Dreissena polymorpha]|uniref:Uncharacterized protein n=1 Tax=Dreissena polymorpha TaxID=45954 RepID=A0A9D4IBI0_DREPO|nr:hypothetical protein DPMN_170409 [Dreissena polymorpha]